MLLFFSPALGAAPPTALAPDEIQTARENLKLSEETRDRIAGEVAGLKASGKASPEVVAAYEVYLARVQEIVVEHQRLLAQMEAAVSAHAGQPPAPAAGAAAGGASSSGGGAEAVDRLQELDRQFNASLAAFDEMLLKELRLIQAASAQRMQGLTEAAAKAGRQAGEKGQAGASAGKDGAEGAEGGGAEQTGGEAAGAGSEQAKRPEDRGKPGEPAGGSQEAGGWGPGGTGAPPGSYTPSADDDIVARQLREAAEKETDPELKAKLWKEYEAYKKSQAKP
ncbi:MAG: hypothetical protein MUC46_08360 [Desulfobacterales bacterium]|nr:hypothetical protein [Desulfobacterales bacterium]